MLTVLQRAKNLLSKIVKALSPVTPTSSTSVVCADTTTGELKKATAANVVLGGLGTITADSMLVSNSAGTGLTWGNTIAGFSIADSVTTYTYPAYVSHLTAYINVTSSKQITYLNTSNALEIHRPTTSVTYPIRFASNSSIEVAYFTNVKKIYGGIYISSCSSFKFIDLSLLDEVTGPIYINSNSALYATYGSWDFLNLRKATSITYTYNPNTFGFPFPNLEVVTGSVNASNNSFTTAQVDNVLYKLGRLDGTNGKCLYGSGLTVNVGGNNAAPGTSTTYGGKTGMEWVDVLVARGATVTHN